MSVDDDYTDKLGRAEIATQALGLVSIVDLAAKLGKSVRTLRRWQAAGRLPPRVKRGRRLMYPPRGGDPAQYQRWQGSDMMRSSIVQSTFHKAAHHCSKAFAKEMKASAEAYEEMLNELRRAVKNGRPKRIKRPIVDRLLRSKISMLVCLVRALDGSRSAGWLRDAASKLTPFCDCGEPITVRAKPKSSGKGWRPICSFGIKRTALQILCVDIISTLLGVDPNNYLARKFGPELASDRIVELAEAGFRYFIIADIKDFFRSVQAEGVRSLTGLPKAVIENCIFVSPDAPLHLLPGHAGHDALEGAVLSGIPQGSRTSQIVAGLLLGPSWRQVASVDRIVSYGDDAAIACSDAEEAHTFEKALPGVLSSHACGPFLLKRCRVEDISKGFDFLKYHYRPYSSPGEFGLVPLQIPTSATSRGSQISFFQIRKQIGGERYAATERIGSDLFAAGNGTAFRSFTSAPIPVTEFIEA